MHASKQKGRNKWLYSSYPSSGNEMCCPEKIPNQKLTVVARHFLVGYNKLKRCVKGKPSQVTEGGHNKRLNAYREDELKRYLSY